MPLMVHKVMLEPNDENGPSGSTNIMLRTKDDYKYNFIENTGADTGTYKYVVVNTAEQ